MLCMCVYAGTFKWHYRDYVGKCVCLRVCVCGGRDGEAHLRFFLASVGVEPMILLAASERLEVWGVEEEVVMVARDTSRLPWASSMILLVSKDTLSLLL